MAKLTDFQQQLMDAASNLSEEFAEYLEDCNAFAETQHTHYKNQLDLQKELYDKALAKFRALVERAVDKNTCMDLDTAIIFEKKRDEDALKPHYLEGIVE